MRGAEQLLDVSKGHDQVWLMTCALYLPIRHIRFLYR